MSGPKVTVIGAGSYFFGKPVIHKMASSEVMRGGTLALVDIDQGKLGTMLKLARRVLKKTKSNVEVEGSTGLCSCWSVAVGDRGILAS